LSRRAIDKAYADRGGAKAALQGGGFRGVRVLAERDGMIFTEGAKRSLIART